MYYIKISFSVTGYDKMTHYTVFIGNIQKLTFKYTNVTKCLKNKINRNSILVP